MNSPFGPSGQFPAVLSSVRVLLVEDDPDGRELFTYTLETRGAYVTPVGLAGDALYALDHLAFDAIVSDIGLPDADGYALIEQVRMRAPELGGQIPAVAVTAYSDVESRARAMTAGFDAFVPKPVDIDELAGVVAVLTHRLAESHRLIEELAAKADVQRSLLARLEALLADRERVLAEGRQLRSKARQIRVRKAH